MSDVLTHTCNPRREGELGLKDKNKLIKNLFHKVWREAILKNLILWSQYCLNTKTRWHNQKRKPLNNFFKNHRHKHPHKNCTAECSTSNGTPGLPTHCKTQRTWRTTRLKECKSWTAGKRTMKYCLMSMVCFDWFTHCGGLNRKEYHRHISECLVTREWQLQETWP